MARCDGCGFLAARNPATGELDEVPGPTRQGGEMGRSGTPQPSWSLECICFVMQPELSRAIRAQPPGSLRDKCVAAIRVEHDCQAFLSWQQGYTPKEHKQMLLEIENKRIASEERIREREVRLAEKKSDRAWNLSVQIGMALGGAILGYVLRGSPATPEVHVHPVIQPAHVNVPSK